ncbi:hypothetical protein JHK87_012291 [Glycine soja]|nr:hypothetical protein JHK87_012291 [Glycine soja]
MVVVSVREGEEEEKRKKAVTGETTDYIYDLPNECLASVFQFLSFANRNCCSLVCWWWLWIKGQSHHRLSLNTESDLFPMICRWWFDLVTKFVLKCDHKFVSIRDDTLMMISQWCPNLTQLKLWVCREISDTGMEASKKNCKGLDKLSGR